MNSLSVLPQDFGKLCSPDPVSQSFKTVRLQVKALVFGTYNATHFKHIEDSALGHVATEDAFRYSWTWQSILHSLHTCEVFADEVVSATSFLLFPCMLSSEVLRPKPQGG